MSIIKPPFKGFVLGYSETSKPTVPLRIDETNPITAGLTVAAISKDGEVIDYVSSTVGTIGSDVTRTNDYIHGSIHKSGGSDTNGKVTFSNLAKWSGSQAFTFVFRYKDTTTVPQGTDDIFHYGGSSFGRFTLRKSSFNIEFYMINSDGDLHLSSSQASSTSWATFGCSGTGGAGSTVRIYKNGVQNATPTAGSRNAKFSTGNFHYIGGNSDAHDNTTTFIYIWNRVLNAEEHRSIYERPYQIFEPDYPSLPYISDSGAQTITGTAAVTAETATSSGTATTDHIWGDGAAQASTATAAGTGLRKVTGSGAVQAATATTQAEADIVWTGTAAVQASTATVSATGERIITATAAVSATRAEAAGLIAEQGSGTLVSFYQDVVKKGSGNLVEFEQSVESPGGDFGTLVTFEQTVKTGSGKFRGLILS